MKILKTLSIFFLILALGFTACKKDEVTETKIIFKFEHLVGTDEVEFDDIKYENAYGNKYSVSTLKYFVSNITLHDESGSLMINWAQYVDARDNSTHTFDPGLKVPVGTYTKVSFTFGLDSANNVSGRFTNPPENLMEWPEPLGGGYHYMKLEGKFDSVGTTKNYQAHTGPTMGNQNYFEVSLTDAAFSCTCEQKTITIKMDINKWWENPNTLDLNEMSMVMGNQPMQEKLKSNGNDVFSAEVN